MTTSTRNGRMDARIRARRARVRADAVRRRQRRTVTLFVLLLLAAGVAVALRSSLFDIVAVRVDGVDGGRVAVVARTAALERGQHLLTAPLDDARARVEALPWVATAVVRRVPPSTVAIDVTPRVPLLTVETDGASWKIDDESVLVDGGRVSGAPVLDLPDASLPEPGKQIEQPVVHDAVEVHTNLPRWLREQVTTYEVSDVHGLVLRLRVPAGQQQDGSRPQAASVRVRFGDADDLALKVEVIRALLPQAVAGGGGLDVRAPANPVVVPTA
ncbi:MAG TPA: FtsQ-type POTRA domain-containing protein [Euzebyales bacterium]